MPGHSSIMHLDLTQTENSVRRICISPFFTAIAFLLLPGVCLLNQAEPAHVNATNSGNEIEETLLVVWVYPFGERMDMPDCWKQFQIRGCRVTDDKGLYSQAHGVLMHHWDIPAVSALPQDPRPPAQKWVWFSMESPTLSLRLGNYGGVYNLTLSYREDSDIPVTYGYLIPNVLLYSVPVGHRVSRFHVTSPSDPPRPNLVAWVVSHWKDSFARVVFYNQLKTYIQVDVFGKAGKPLPKESNSVLELAKKYIFYLSTENSQHPDYITEKLWNALHAGAIPVVLGPSRENYERFLPAEAFIHVDDFLTVQELAEYMLLVKNTPSLMERHLSWKKSFSAAWGSSWHEHFCMACLGVKLNKGKTKVIRNLEHWFSS